MELNSIILDRKTQTATSYGFQSEKLRCEERPWLDSLCGIETNRFFVFEHDGKGWHVRAAQPNRYTALHFMKPGRVFVEVEN